MRTLPHYLYLLIGLISSCYGQAAQPAHPGDYLRIEPIRQAGSDVHELGYARSKINATSFKHHSLTTAESDTGARYQFVSYYSDDQKLVVGRRKLLEGGWSDWDLRRTAFTSLNINDNHNVSSIGVDRSGVLHVSWGMHNDPLLYTRSTAPVTNDRPFALYGDTTGNSAGLGGEITPSKRVTYPLFFSDPGSGELLFSFRIGSSGNGDLQLVRWNADAGGWVAVHQAPAAPWIDGDYDGDSLPSVNAYPNNGAFDSSGNLHVTWTWRTGHDSPTPFGDYQSNHDIMYAWSPNQGVDWYRQDGSLYQRDGRHAIDESNAPPVVRLPEGSSLINHTHTATGPDGAVYLAQYWAPRAEQGDHLRQYMLAWQQEGAWRVSQIGRREPENTNDAGVSQRVGERQLRRFRITRPIVVVDDANRVIVAFTDWQRGRRLTIVYSEDSDRNDWRLFDLPTEDMGDWEPTLDPDRWRAEGVLSLFYQVQGAGQDASPVSVLEWDARRYFANEDRAF